MSKQQKPTMPAKTPSVDLKHVKSTIEYDGETATKIIRHWFRASNASPFDTRKAVLLRIDLLDQDCKKHGSASCQLKRKGLYIENPLVYVDQPYSDTPVEFHYYTISSVFGKASMTKKVFPEGNMEDLTWRENDIRATNQKADVLRS